MQQVSPLRLVVAIPEAYVAGAFLRQPVEFTVAAFPGEVFTGKHRQTLAAVARARSEDAHDGS